MDKITFLRQLGIDIPRYESGYRFAQDTVASVYAPITLSVQVAQVEKRWVFLCTYRVTVGSMAMRFPQAQEVEGRLQYEWGFAPWTDFSGSPVAVPTSGAASWSIPETSLQIPGLVRVWGKHLPSGAEFAREINLHTPASFPTFTVHEQTTLNVGKEMPSDYT